MKKRIITVSLSEFIKSNLYLGVFILGLVVATVVVNLLGVDNYFKINITEEYYIGLLRDTVVDKFQMFKYEWIVYLKELLFVLFINIFSFGIFVNVFYLLHKGATVAIIISSFVLKYGPGGALIYVISVFPHYLIYVPAIIFSLYAGKKIRNEKKEINLKRSFLCFGIIVGFSMVIAFLETYINIYLLKSVL